MNLPKPQNAYERNMEISESNQSERTQVHVPPYGQRMNWAPNGIEDYGDGGAFPEIHVAQYPLNMGRPGSQKSRAVVRVDADANGKVKYDRIVKHGANDGKLIHTSLADLKEKTEDIDLIALPGEDEEAATAERTRLALEAKMEGKIRGPGKSSAHPLTQKATEKAPQYVRYNVNPHAPGFNAATQQRVIKMVEAPVDPMEPPKHKLGKAERTRPVGGSCSGNACSREEAHERGTRGLEDTAMREQLEERERVHYPPGQASSGRGQGFTGDHYQRQIRLFQRGFVCYREEGC